MSYIIPPTQERIDANVARFEVAIGQKIPGTDLSFAQLVAVIQGMSATGIQKFAAERARQALIISADLEGLKYLGTQYGVDYKYATAAEIKAALNGISGTIITSDNYWTGDANGVRYESEEDIVLDEILLPGQFTEVELTAVQTGDVGNLEAGDTLKIGNAVAGYQDNAYVTELVTEAVDDEETEDYRARMLNVVRSRGGGGNSADYRKWAEETPGVRKAYPYGGVPYFSTGGGVELITNGGFEADVSGWTDSSDSEGQVVWSSSYSGSMRLQTAPV